LFCAHSKHRAAGCDSPFTQGTNLTAALADYLQGGGAEVKFMNEHRTERRGRAFVVLLILALAVLLVVGLVSAFQVGVSIGMASAGIGFIAYQVPALAFDWPRLTLDDIFAFFDAAFGWICDLFSW
jgi:hypothetical protein